jgi:hypothetical protein
MEIKMAENMPEEPPTPLPIAPRTRRRWLWGAAAAVTLFAAIGVFFLGWGLLQRPPEVSLEGELIVIVMKKGGEGKESSRIEELGAVPVRAGDKMHLTVRFNQPACTYLVWLDSHGKAAPLYPWNQDNIEVKEVTQRPPDCQPVKIIFSPMTIGNGWEFDRQGGLETVLLLARRTPLGENVRLGALLGSAPVAKLRDPCEVAIFGLDRRKGSVESLLSLKRGSAAEVREVDASLLALMDRVKDEFELIRAVRFAHEGE